MAEDMCGVRKQIIFCVSYHLNTYSGCSSHFGDEDFGFANLFAIFLVCFFVFLIQISFISSATSYVFLPALCIRGHNLVYFESLEVAHSIICAPISIGFISH